MSFKIIKLVKVAFSLVWPKLKPKDYVNVNKTKTAAREGFENSKFGPRAPATCRPLAYIDFLYLVEFIELKLL